MGLFSKHESYVGVDIGANGIKLVELRKNKGRPQLWTYGILDRGLDIHIPMTHEKDVDELLHEDDLTYKKEEPKNFSPSMQESIIKDERVDEYAKLLKALLKKTKVQTTKATSSLPVSHVFHAIINLPKVGSKEIQGIVKAEVAKMLPRPVEEMQVVHQLIPSSQSGDKKHQPIRILVTAAPRELVAFYTAIFQKAGLFLRELETEAFALERSLVGLDKATAMIVDIGAERTNFFIIDQGLPLTHRTISIGGNTVDHILQKTLGVELKATQQIKRDLARNPHSLPIVSFSSVLEPILKEIEYSFDLFLHQTGNEGKRPEKIILTGGSAILPFLVEEIKKKFIFLKDIYWGTDSIWSEGYFVTTVGRNESLIKKYIEDQGKKDSGQTLFSV